ncbi:P-loop containing nucleoside triphosphate hydrolase protein [Trametes punicea]|nr:P-loop containing nucleoside triphosphate hydrolase protein [Trametes punicea]
MLSSETTRPTSSPGPGGSQAEGLAATGYARTAKELNDFVRSIRAEGAQSDLNLPRIAVIGNQSAGKSSLVEAMSKIKVPRDAGTCTRCPMELRLSSSDEEWTCQVAVRWECGPDGRGSRQVREVPFGDCLTDPDDVELMLRRAQAAVLNMKTDQAYYLDKDAEALKQLSKDAPQTFSRNVVCIDLTGPGLPDISFVDLPGLIQNDDGNGEVQLVEELVRSYISSSNTLILMALPMTDDIQNQKAAQLAREVDPNGLRTIGALTKPDAIPDGSLGLKRAYLDVVEGRAHRTRHGYYVVRQPDDAERQQKITHAQARAAETKFFASQKPWAASEHRHRFGVDNLIGCVSERLTELIRADLPRIQQEVSAQRGECMRRLEALPPKTTEPQIHVLRLTTSFADEVKQYIQGSPEYTKLVQANKQAYEKLVRAIFASAPPFVPYVTGDFVGDLSLFVPSEPQRALFQGRVIMLDTVRDRIRARITRELPNNVPYSVKRSFIQAFQENWSTYVTQCFEEVEAAFKHLLTSLVDQHFVRFNGLKRSIRSIVLELVDVHAVTAKQQQKFLLKYESNTPSTQNIKDLAKSRAEWLAAYKDVRAKRFMANKSIIGTPQTEGPSVFSFASTKASAFGDPSSSSKAMPTFGFPPASPAQFGSGVSASLTSTLVPSEGKAVPPAPSSPAPAVAPSLQPIQPATDPFEEEVMFMAEVRAYFDIASKRFVDNITAAIDEHLLYAFSDVLFDTLVEKLGLTSEDARAKCAKYLAEDPDVSALREELQAKKKRLDKVHKELCEFGL